MKSLLQIFWEKPLDHKILLIRISMLLGFAGLANLVLPFKVYSRLLGQINSESPKNAENIDWDHVKQVARSIENVNKVSPLKFKCLTRATAGKILIAQKEIESTVYFGVKKDESKNLQAHAWLRVGPEIVIGGDIADQFSVVSKFS